MQLSIPTTASLTLMWHYARMLADIFAHIFRVEKYRPQTLDDLISHKNILSTSKYFISEDRLPHLFYGPPGTGKSSTILGTAKQLDKDNEFNAMVLEVRSNSVHKYSDPLL
uniref:ATPase AAA-type core domain-containing protein n=1 Tax=Oncorhynchus kisutch TaxID=8019 RepID=A0A8C7JT16_ONCKI